MCDLTEKIQEQLSSGKERDVFAHAERCHECRVKLLQLDAYPPGCREPIKGHYVLRFLNVLAEDTESASDLRDHIAICEICRVEVADARTALENTRMDFAKYKGVQERESLPQEDDSVTPEVPTDDGEKSMTVVNYPIIAALVKGEEIIGANRIWAPRSFVQRWFLDQCFLKLRRDIDYDRVRCIKSVASWNAEDVNAFLRANGFAIEIPPLAKNEFGVASILDLLVEWEEKGKITKIKTPYGELYPAVRMSKTGFYLLEAEECPHPIVGLRTKDPNVIVYMTMIDQPPVNYIDICTMAERFSSKKKIVNNPYDGVVFPMVNLDQLVDISWIQGLQTETSGGLPVIIAKALQQTRLRINNVGARAQSSFAMVGLVLGGSDERYLEINQPFVVWFEQKGIREPLFVGYIVESDWKNPEGLGDSRADDTDEIWEAFEDLL